MSFIIGGFVKKIFELDFRGRKIIVENGELAKQAHGSVLIRYGDTVILSTVVMSKNVNLLADFFPLTVLYNEKLYSVGKIPGGFIKREGRPTENATLAARMIDRPMRPLFPEDFKNEVNRTIIEKLYKKYEETNSDIEDFLILFEDEQVVNKLSSIMMENEENFDVDKCLQDVIKNFNKEKLITERNYIIQKLKDQNLSSEETLKLESELSKVLVKIAQSK